MKKILALAILIGLPIFGASNVEASTSNLTYNCAITKEPAKPDWVWYRYPTVKNKTRDAYNNGRVHLIWEDSYRAHRVEIRYRELGKTKWKSFTTEDDASTWVRKLKNGVRYEFQVRGVSNCGKSGWQSENRIRA